VSGVRCRLKKNWHPAPVTRYLLFLTSLFFESALFKLVPSLFRLAGQIARQSFDRDLIGGAELTPEQKARVVLSRLVRDFIRQLRWLPLFILPQFVFPRS